MGCTIRTGPDHALLNAHRVLPGPLGDLLVHFRDLGRVHGPQATLSLAAVRGRLLDLLEALVQAQVVSDRVLPAGRGGAEVGEVLAVKLGQVKLELSLA